MASGFFKVYIATSEKRGLHIGDGNRTVFAKEGTKWVHLVDPFTLKTDRIGLHEWKEMKPTMRATPKKLARYVKSRVKDVGSHLMTSLVKEMLQYGKEHPA